MRDVAKRPPKPPAVDPIPRNTWICEGCGNPTTALNPPDECYCGHRYFSNLEDELREAAEDDVRH